MAEPARAAMAKVARILVDLFGLFVRGRSK